MTTCSRCGAANADVARFCQQCGARVEHRRAGDATAEVRKTVTILFSDITSSTQLGETLDAERVRALMTRYFGAAREAIERHGGSVEKFIGDAVVAVFGVPTVHEDDGLRAVRAAADIRTAVERLSEDEPSVT